MSRNIKSNSECAENMELSHASVYRIKDETTEIVLISDLEDFYPKDAEDFDRKQKYKYWFEEEEFVKVYILRLGTSVEDILEQNEAKRLRIPNKRQESFFSDNEEDTAPRKRKPIGKRQLFLDENEFEKKEKHLMKSRKNLIDSDEDSNSCEYNEKLLEVEQLEKHSGSIEEDPIEINKSIESTKSDDTIIINPDDGMRKVARFSLSRIHGDQPAEKFGTVSPQGGTQHTSAVSPSSNSVLPQSTLEPAPGPSHLAQRPLSCGPPVSSSPQRVSLPLGSINSRIGNHVAATGGNTLNTGRRDGASRGRQNDNSAGSPVRQVIEINQRDPQPLYTSVNEQVYVGAGRYVYEDVWALMLMKNDSRFVRDMAEIMWGKIVLRKRYIRKPHAGDSENEENAENDDIKTVTPEKYKLVKDALRFKIKMNQGDNPSPGKRALRMKRIWRYMSDKLYDVKEKRKRNRKR